MSIVESSARTKLKPQQLPWLISHSLLAMMFDVFELPNIDFLTLTSQSYCMRYVQLWIGWLCFKNSLHFKFIIVLLWCTELFRVFGPAVCFGRAVLLVSYISLSRYLRQNITCSPQTNADKVQYFTKRSGYWRLDYSFLTIWIAIYLKR